MGKKLIQENSIANHSVSQTLKEKEDMFRSIFENSPAGKSIMGLDGSLRVNKAFCNILGYSDKELKGKNWKELTHPDDIQKSQDVMNSLFKGEKKFARYEKRYINKKGNVVWTDVSTSLQRDANKTPLYFITMIIDITQIKESTEKLKRSEERSRSFIELTGQIAWVTNPKGEVVEDIPYFRNFTGLSYDQVKGSGWASALHPDDIAKTFGIWNNAVLAKSSYEAEYRLKRHDGVYRDLLAKGSPVFNKNGDILEWVGVCIDITERKQAEKIIQESEAKYRTLVENIPQSIFMKDRNYRWVSINENFASQLGVRPNDIIGKTDSDLFPGEIADKYHADDVRIMKTGETEEFEEESILDGRRVWVNTVKTPVRDKKEDIVGILGIFWDITERKHAQEQLKNFSKELEQKVKELDNANSDLKRSNQELEQFAYVASHDLQEPLRMVSSYTQLLERRYKDQLDQDAKDFIFYAVDGANRMQRLINDLLDYSRVTTKGKPFLKLDLASVLGQAIANLQKKIQETGAMIVNDDLPFAYGDEVQLVRVFQNLLDNAMKFTGTDPPRINVSSKTVDDKIQISVSDNGIGIDKIYTERVFTIFQRLHTKVEYPGTGIGLAICKRTIERHGGKIWFESEPGKGTTFCFTLNFK